MNKKIAYLIAGLIIYFIIGMIMSYFSYSFINWRFVIFWTICMTIADFFVIRNIKRWLSKNKTRE